MRPRYLADECRAAAFQMVDDEFEVAVADLLIDEIEFIAMAFDAEVEAPARTPHAVIIQTPFGITRLGNGVDAMFVHIGGE